MTTDHGRDVARRLVSRLAVAAAACALAPAAAHAAVGASFGSPQLIDGAAPFSIPWDATLSSCSSADHCVALGTFGSLALQASTTNPSQGDGTPTWSTPTDVGLPGLTPAAISCPTDQECVVVGADSQTQTSDVVSSTDGGASWSVLATFAATVVFQSVGCTTDGECVAVDNDGDAFYGAASGGWSGPDPLSDATDLSFSTSSASCFGTACVVTASAGKKAVLISSPDITTSSPQWTAVDVADADQVPTAVSCTSGGICVAVDNGGNAIVSTDGGSSWKLRHTGDANAVLDAVSCVGGAACVLADTGGETLVATDMASGSPKFTPIFLKSAALTSLSCPSTSWCLGDASDGTVAYGQLDTASPQQTVWSSGQVSGANPLTALACSGSGALCAAGDPTGRILVTEDGGASWTEPISVSGTSSSVSGLSCTSDGMCLAIEGGEAYTTTGLEAGGSPSWSSGTALGEPLGVTIDGISCPSEQLCVAVDNAGNAAVSTGPAAASPAWTIASTGASSLGSISCPSASLCVAAGAGEVWYSTDPGSSAAWSGPDDVDPGETITAITCESGGSCVAGDNDGQVLDTSDITQGADSWSDPVATGVSVPVLSIACTDAEGGLCAASTGKAGDGGNPVVGPSDVESGAWSVAATAPADLTQVACATGQTCLWTDAAGDAMASTIGRGSVALSSAALLFPDTAVARTSAAETVTVTDTGPGALNIGGWSLTGPGSASFPVDGDTCTGTTLASGQSCAISVGFAPAAVGPQTADLQIESDDPASPAVVSLSGTGVPGTAGTPATRHRTGGSAGRARFTRAAVTGTLIDAIVLCEGRSGARCSTRLSLTAHEHLKGRQLVSVSDARRTGGKQARLRIRPITLASGRATLAASRGRVVHLSLDATGRRLLKQFGTLRATLTAAQTVAGKTVRTRRFHLSFSAHHNR